ncbi:MAG TPA: hypothetical protein VHE55_09515 [Fimbriimonadaceae bacterium]|nr:hypothetical protein [Fimbriimonadaceae bacterium]
MKRLLQKRTLAVALCGLAATAMAADAFSDLVKIIGVGAAVTSFAPKFNDAINKLANHRDTPTMTTKVVPILSGGINSRKAVGAAQVMGPRAQVEKVKAVAQIEQDLFGKEVKIRAMIPIETKNIVSDMRRVEGVAVSGIVDLKL